MTWLALMAFWKAYRGIIIKGALVFSVLYLAYNWAYDRGADATAAYWSKQAAALERKHQEEEKVEDDYVAAQLAASQKLVYENEVKYNAEKRDYDRKIAGLKRDIAAGNARLSFPGSCKETSPSAHSPAISGVDGTGTCELSQTASSDLYSLAIDADNCAIQLTGLQGYVAKILEVHDGPSN
jgi:hypothetical protein